MRQALRDQPRRKPFHGHTFPVSSRVSTIRMRAVLETNRAMIPMTTRIRIRQKKATAAAATHWANRAAPR